MSISVVVHVCEDVDYIEDCLKSVEWADEIVIIDQESNDGSIDICRGHTDRIFPHTRVPVVELARDFGISKATGDMVLVLDPDERVTPELRLTLLGLAEKGDADGYALPRVNLMFGREIRHTGWGGDRHLRFFRRGAVKWPATVHSVPEVSGSTKVLNRSQGCIVHINYTSIAQFVEKLNRYTGLEADRLRREGRPFSWLKLFYQPGKEFLNRYIRHKGYRDGLVGLILSMMMVAYTLVTYVKLWEVYDTEERKVVP
jgi:glycosyltransferase involved in cell wall biosynthesis